MRLDATTKSEQIAENAATQRSFERGQEREVGARNHAVSAAMIQSGNNAMVAIAKMGTVKAHRTHQEEMEMERLRQEGRKESRKRKYEHEMEMEKLRQEDRKHERQHAMDMEQLKQGVALEKDQVTK